MFITNDGATFFARDERHLVELLHNASYSPRETDAKFMADVADRVSMQFGRRIRTDRVEHFIADLTAAGLISEQSAN